jgi:hypothetical protein
MTTAFPTGGREIVERMTRQYPELFVNDDDLQRKLTQRIGEQFALVYGPKWGNKKRAGLSDEHRSKDSLAVQEDDGTTSVWDMFSSGLDILVHDGDQPIPGTHANLPPSEATFMPCEPRNWLDDSPGEPPPASDLEDRLEALEAQAQILVTVVKIQEEELKRQDRRLDALEERVAEYSAEFVKTWKVVGFMAHTALRRHVLSGVVNRE